MTRGARARQERSRAELVSTVAHELRSPLTSVKGFTATLLAKWDRFTDEQKRLMLETVNADADRVTRLITELLDVSRIESGRLELRRQLGRPRPPVAPRTSRAVVAARRGPRPVPSASSRDGLPEMWVDPDKLDQVLGNLLENAVRHGARHRHHRRRAVRTAELAVSVTRRGRGHPARGCAPRVFTRFWRGGRRGGTGLGLTSSRAWSRRTAARSRCGRAPERRGAVPIYRCPPAPPTSPTDAAGRRARPRPSRRLPGGQSARCGGSDATPCTLSRGLRSSLMSAPNKSYDPVEVTPLNADEVERMPATTPWPRSRPPATSTQLKAGAARARRRPLAARAGQPRDRRAAAGTPRPRPASASAAPARAVTEALAARQAELEAERDAAGAGRGGRRRHAAVGPAARAAPGTR